jgi:hypothetical protein
MASRIDATQVDLTAELQIALAGGRAARQLIATGAHCPAINGHLDCSGSQMQFDFVPLSIVDGLFTKNVYSASTTAATGICAHPQVTFNEFHGSKIRLGRWATAVKQNSLSTQCLELEAQRRASFSDTGA